MRAVYSENQLTEVLTDFWFNHFNVTTRDGGARSRVLTLMSAMRFVPMCWASFA